MERDYRKTVLPWDAYREQNPPFELVRGLLSCQEDFVGIVYRCAASPYPKTPYQWRIYNPYFEGGGHIQTGYTVTQQEACQAVDNLLLKLGWKLLDDLAAFI